MEGEGYAPELPNFRHYFHFIAANLKPHHFYYWLRCYLYYNRVLTLLGESPVSVRMLNPKPKLMNKLESAYILLITGIFIGPLYLFPILLTIGYAIGSLLVRLFLFPYCENMNPLYGYWDNVKEQTQRFFNPLLP